MFTDNRDRGHRKSLGGIVASVTGIVSAVAGVLALLVTGGETAPRSAPMSTWATRANAICKDAASDITALGGADTPEQLAVAMPRARLANRQLAALARPAGARDRIARMIALSEQSYDHIEAALTALAASNDQAAREAVSAAEEASARADSLARELGANSCLESPAQSS